MDLEITELLVTSLLVQATRAMVAEGSQTTRSGTSRTRSFRQSFLVSYATHIGERLDEAGARAHDPVEDERLLPVLAERSRVVEETFENMFSDLVERSRRAIGDGQQRRRVGCGQGGRRPRGHHRRTPGGLDGVIRQVAWIKVAVALRRSV